MADPTTSTATPSTGGLNLGDYQQRIQQAAASTREVSGGLDEQATKTIQQAGAGLRGTYAGQAAGLRAGFQAEEEATKKQAEKSATALEMTGAATERYISGLEAIQEKVSKQVSSASDSWAAAAEKADEYVKASRSRVDAVLSKLDEIHKQIGQDRDFAKAHALQASVQAVTGSMKEEERNIAMNYGTDSKEYEQFQQSKRTTLATIQSNIQASFQQMQEQHNTTYMNVTADAMTKSHMYVGFQEQQHVEMLRYKEESANAMALQTAQFEVGLEQMKMAGMENLANWIADTPSFTMDVAPLITGIADIVATQKAAEQAWDTANPPIRVPGMSSGYSPQARSTLNTRLAEQQSRRYAALY